MNEELFSMTGTKLIQLIQSRQLGVEELTSSYMERIEKYDGADGLNAVAELNEYALKQAKQLDEKKSAINSPLSGLPILVKDNIDVAGLHTTAGSLAIADNIAQSDAPIIANLRRNGALILGKTNMTEFANYTTVNMSNGYSSRGGQVKSAYNKEKSPSGSSSGSAVAMSAGFCGAALGTDTSFSIVGCVTENGVTGIKPAYGSLPSQGIIPIAKTLDSAGPITRNLEDALLIYSCMRDKPSPLIEAANPKNIRLGVNTFDRDQVSEAQLMKYETVFDALRQSGGQITELNHGHTKHQKDIMQCEFRHDLEDYLSNSTAEYKTLDKIVEYYENNPESMMKYGNTLLRGALDHVSGKLDDEAYIIAIKERQRLRAQILEELRNFDACVMTGPTNIMHFIGLPSLAIRLGMGNDGMPRGMILYGANESSLFSAALTLEKYCAPVLLPQL